MHRPSRIFVALVAGVAASSAAPASAKPLPKGMAVVLVKGRPMVKQGGLTVALFDDERQGAGATIQASLSDDGASLEVVWDRCGMGDDPDASPEAVPLAHVQARLENLRGMASHKKKKYADAITHFRAAVALDPDQPMFATNLLSAQALSGALDDADRVLAASGPRNRPWFAWRLAVDPELAALKGRPSVAALLGATRGTATFADLDADQAALAGGLVAIRSNLGDGGPGSPIETELLVYDPKAARELLRLPVETMADACDDSPGEDSPLPKCTAKQRASTAAHRKAADGVLADLGFVVAKGAMAAIPLDGTATVTSPDRKTTIAVDADALHVKTGKRSFDVDRDVRMDFVVFAGANLLVEWSERHIYFCDDDSFRTGLAPAAPSTP